MMQKPYSTACERNKEPILAVIKQWIHPECKVLEIGSGTGQHLVYFAAAMPEVTWQPSDLAVNLAAIQAWITEAKLTNIKQPLKLNVRECDWLNEQYDVVYSANTTHIMAWDAVEAMFRGVASVLKSKAVFLLYGPFNYHGEYTSESNRQFDQSLQLRDAHMGLRDIDDLLKLAERNHLELIKDYAMPANNRILVWRKNDGTT